MKVKLADEFSMRIRVTMCEGSQSVDDELKIIFLSREPLNNWRFMDPLNLWVFFSLLKFFDHEDIRSIDNTLLVSITDNVFVLHNKCRVNDNAVHVAA